MEGRRNFLKKSLLLAAGSFIPSRIHGIHKKSTMMDAQSIDFNRRLAVSYDADVVIVGGGIAGVSAACASAASGASVILIERFGTFGGMLTTGGVANFCGQIDAQGEVFDEILHDLRRHQALGEGRRASLFNYEILSLVLQEILLKRNVKVLLHTRLADVQTTGSNITECIISGKSGLEAVRGKIFIDCSGDADIARYAKVSTMKGDPVNGYQLPMSRMFFVREVEENAFVQQVPDTWRTKISREEDLPMTSVWPDGPGGRALKLKIPMFDSTSTESLTNAEIQSRRRSMDVLYYYQNIKKENWRLTHGATIIGIREGCRIEGDYVLKVDDLRAGATFDDAVARGTFYLDGHGLADDKRTYILPRNELDVPPYQIPMRSLVSKDANNLLMAGRCMSADQLALSSARVSTSCSMMGQAVGIAAALAVQKNTNVRNLDYLEIQKEVLKRGAQLDVSEQIYPIYR
jgi:hypothetical protein